MKKLSLNIYSNILKYMDQDSTMNLTLTSKFFKNEFNVNKSSKNSITYNTALKGILKNNYMYFYILSNSIIYNNIELIKICINKDNYNPNIINKLMNCKNMYNDLRFIVYERILKYNDIELLQQITSLKILTDFDTMDLLFNYHFNKKFS